MPRYNNLSLVIDSSFRPFTFQERLAPLLLYKDAYDKASEAYTDIASKKDRFKYLEGVLEENPDDLAANIYKNYTDEYNKYVEDFSKNGMNMMNVNGLTNLKRRYAGEIGRLEEADTQLKEIRKNRNTLAASGKQMLYAQDNPTLSDILNNNYNPYSVDTDELYKRGMALGKAASSRQYSRGESKNNVLGGYYKLWTEANGVSPQSIADFLTSDEIQSQLDSNLLEMGVDNLSEDKRMRAKQSLMNGIYNGIVYQESVKPIRDESRMKPSEAARLQLSRDQLNYNAAREGFRQAKPGAPWEVYDPYTDAYLMRHGKTGAANPTGISTDNPYVKGNTDLKKILQNNGRTNDGKVLTGTDITNAQVTKLSTNASSLYPPFFGDAWHPNAKHGFDNFNSNFSEGDALKYSMDRLTSDAAKNEVREYVRGIIPTVVQDMEDEDLDKVIELMDFKRDYDYMSDSSFRLAIPGTNDEGKVVRTDEFNDFLSKVNQLKLAKMRMNDLNTIAKGLAAEEYFDESEELEEEETED